MGTLTITTTAAQDARIVDAFGKELGLTDAQGNPRNATGAEAKALIIQRGIRDIVNRQEDAAGKAAVLAPAALNPT